MADPTPMRTPDDLLHQAEGDPSRVLIVDFTEAAGVLSRVDDPDAVARSMRELAEAAIAAG